MPDTSRPLALRRLLFPTLLFRLPLLPAIAAKRLVTVAISTFVALTMGRTVLARLDTKRQTSTSSEKHPSTIQIEDKSCPICQEPVGTRNAEGIKEGWSMLPCGHRFGSHCIKRYLGITADESPLCPMCRHVAYHDACGHPVLPFLLKSDGTHPDLITDSSGNTHPPRGDELMTMSCEYCQPRDENKTRPRGRRLSRVSTYTWKKPLGWLRAVLPMARQRSQSQSPSRETPAGADQRLSRQQARARRRTQIHAAVWEGPWMDVQSRDLDWENWWKEQAPRGA